MFQFYQLTGLLYVGDFLFLAALSTIIIKLKLEKSNQGFSAKTQGVYGVVVCTRNIDLLFVEGSIAYLVYSISKKIINISCIIYIVFKIKNTSKNTTTCSCNQDSFWVEALVLPCIIITAVFHYGASPEEVLWSFSTYLEALAMVPQLYLIHVRGKGDSYLPAYIALMAIYTFTDAMAYCLNSFLYDKMPPVWPACKCLQLAIYIWYILIPREPVLPVANCEERKRRATIFIKQQSMLAQTLLNKNNSASDLQVYTLTSPANSSNGSMCSSAGGFYFGGSTSSIGDTPSPPQTPCIKFDIGCENESIRLKAPTIPTIRHFKNKGTLKLNSLPASPEISRKLSRSFTVDCFRPINEFTQFDTAMSQRAKRMNRIGSSLPTTPVPVRKSELPFKYPVNPLFRSISQNNTIQKKKKRRNYHLDVSLPSTPEPSRKAELILRPPSSYRSLSHLPITQTHQSKFHLKRPPLPRVDGSPAFDKKSDQTINIPPLVTQNNPSPKPERPPPPKKYKIKASSSKDDNTLKETQTDDSKLDIPINTQLKKDTTICTETDSKKKLNIPKRPPPPKLIITTSDATNA